MILYVSIETMTEKFLLLLIMIMCLKPVNPILLMMGQCKKYNAGKMANDRKINFLSIEIRNILPQGPSDFPFQLPNLLEEKGCCDIERSCWYGEFFV